MANYDIVVVGGGVAGSAFAKAMAERGYHVLIVERDAQFRDRVRGEFVFPWGVAEATELGVYDALIGAGGHHPTYWHDYAGPNPLRPRDFAETTPQRLRGLSVYHPVMQEALLQAAAAAGAEIRRGARVGQIEPGPQPAVVVADAAGVQTVVARLVVGADGRASTMRKLCGFESRNEADGNIIAGVLLTNVPASADSSICMINPFASRSVLYLPQTRDSGRAYLISRSEGGVRLHGDSDFERFLDECANSGLADGLLNGATQAGPLATFEGADSWVDHPYMHGCALIGDAAATSDPSWGQGLSITLRDARELRDALLSDDDWDAAAHAYAAAHDRYFALVHTAVSWYTKVFLEPGPEADELRSRVLPQMKSDPFILPDTLVSGPDAAPPTDAQRSRIFGEALGGAALSAS